MGRRWLGSARRSRARVGRPCRCRTVPGHHSVGPDLSGQAVPPWSTLPVCSRLEAPVHDVSTSPPDGTPAPAASRARFEAEVAVAGIAVADEDREPLFAMWVELQPIRDRLRAVDLA